MLFSPHSNHDLDPLDHNDHDNLDTHDTYEHKDNNLDPAPGKPNLRHKKLDKHGSSTAITTAWTSS